VICVSKLTHAPYVDVFSTSQLASRNATCPPQTVYMRWIVVLIQERRQELGPPLRLPRYCLFGLVGRGDNKFRSHARWALVPRAPVDDSTLPQGSTRDAEHPDTFVLRVGVGEGKSEWRRRSGLGIGPCAADGVATLVMMPTHRRKMVRRRLCASGSVGADSKCATAVRPLAPLNFRLPRRRCLVGRETTISYSTIVVVSCSSDTSLVGVSLPTRTCRSRGDVADDKLLSTTPSLFCSMAMTLLTTRQPTYCRTMAPWIRQIPVTSL
jgi:hypothetical protein